MKNSIFGGALTLSLLFACLLASTRDGVIEEANSGLGERVQRLTEMSAERTIVTLDADGYRRFVATPPRNYSMIIMFTAVSSRRHCSICRHASDEFQVLAGSYRTSSMYSDGRLFFGTLDFDDGSDVFKSLELSSAPAFVHFPAQGKPLKSDTMDIQRLGYAAETISKWINGRTGIPIRVMRSPNYFGVVVLLCCIISISGITYLERNTLDFLRNKTMWAVTALGFCFMMTSGQMWNHIRGPPFLHKAVNTGRVSYIHGSSQAQFIIETYIIIILNAAAAFGMIVVCEAAEVTNGGGDVEKRRFSGIVGLVLFVAAFTIVLSIHRLKSYG